MKKFLALVVLMMSTSVMAQSNSPNISYSMAGVEGGFKWSSADVENAQDTKQVLGFNLGVSGVINIAPIFGIKTGLFYTERAFEASNATVGVDYKGKVTYFDVPLLFMFKFEEYAGIYVGPSLSVKLGSEGLRSASAKGTVTPITVGAQFKFAPNLGANIYFESVSGEIADGVKNSRSVGANLLVTFD